jgi:hypothetical protein
MELRHVILLMQLKLDGEHQGVLFLVNLIMVDEDEVEDEGLDLEVEVDEVVMMIHQKLVEIEFYKDPTKMGLMNNVILDL